MLNLWAQTRIFISFLNLVQNKIWNKETFICNIAVSITNTLKTSYNEKHNSSINR